MRLPRSSSFLTHVFPVVLLAAVPWGSGCTQLLAQCQADDQCDPGETCVDGMCQDADTADASTVSSSSGSVSPWDGGEHPDSGTTAADAASTQVCPHNDDNTLTAAELPLALGVVSRFVATTADGGIPVDLVGTMEDGGRVWHFEAALPGDHQLEVAAAPLETQWYASHFPDGGYVVPLDGEGKNFGIFRRTAAEVQLVGAASNQPDSTLLDYDPPIRVTPFPISLGDIFSSTTHNSGTFEGNSFYSSTDTYDTTVDARGTVVTPAGAFPVLRVRVQQTVKIPIAWWPFEMDYAYIRYSFMTPCYGQVVSVASFEGEQTLLFTKAAEVRRLGLAP